jgi:hypothetical protein
LARRFLRLPAIKTKPIRKPNQPIVIVVVTSFFAALAIGKGKFDERTISLTGDAAIIIGWLGFLIGLVLMAGNLKNLLANDAIGPAFSVAFLIH